VAGGANAVVVERKATKRLAEVNFIVDIMGKEMILLYFVKVWRFANCEHKILSCQVVRARLKIDCMQEIATNYVDNISSMLCMIDLRCFDEITLTEQKK
jgi:hypothetical protein